MQIEVRDGSGTLWVEEFACFLDSGELAFSYQELPAVVAPDWYQAPDRSVLRSERKSNNPEYPDEEVRSSSVAATEVLRFYNERAIGGGLILTESPVADHALELTTLSRLTPGFFGQDDSYRLSLDIYEHRRVSFWCAKYRPKPSPEFRSKKEPKYLIFVGAENGKVTLQNPETGDTLWAPSDALTDDRPRHAQYPKREPSKKVLISWGLLPDWLKLEIAPETEVTATSSFSGGALAGFSCMKLSRDPGTELQDFLDRLDASGFDPTGTQCPGRSYYLHPKSGGRIIEVHVFEQSGDKAKLTFTSTVQEPLLYAYYETPRTLEELLRGQ
jgi:hypothetical protein